MEIVIEEEVERGHMESKIGYTWEDESASILQSKMGMVGYDKVKVLGLTKRKYVIRMEVEVEEKKMSRRIC